MLVLDLRFPAGRFHATPWGRNVNEGVVEWPPSPYRLARALVDVCRRRRPHWGDERLAAVLRSLEGPPRYRLPRATTGHTRAYLSSNDKDPTKKQKILDAFVVVDREAPLLMEFQADVAEAVCNDLDDLLCELNYLGRSESWVRARVAADWNAQGLDCQPAHPGADRYDSELVRVACLCPEEEYAQLEHRPTARGRGRRRGAPLSWLEALSLSTGELLRDGWSAPPAQRKVDYLRPPNALVAGFPRHCRTLESRFTIAKYALHSSVLPRVIETVPLAERIRSHLMGIHRKVCGGDPAAVSPLFSGKAPQGGPASGHEHAFILPLDEDCDGRIDHVLLKVATPFDARELAALDQLRTVWQPGGRQDIHLVLNTLSPGLSGHPSTCFVSATPFVTARHHRRGRGKYEQWLAAEIDRECKYHCLPAPKHIEWTDRTQVEGHEVRWMEFVRSRKGDRPLRGHGCVLELEKPVQGPFALGALCHFGLGLFVPWRDTGSMP